MGAISDATLRATPPPEGTPAPVGDTPALREATATIIENTGGRIEYGGETRITVAYNEPKELALDSRRILYWSGLVVKTNDSKWSGYSIVAALYPTQWNWFAHAKLRRGPKTTEAGQRAIRKHLDNGLPLRDLTIDPFESDRGWWVARLNDPMRLHWENGQSLGNGYLHGLRPQAETPTWFFGICNVDLPAVAKPEQTGYLQIPQNSCLTEEDLRRAAFYQALAGRRKGEEISFEETRRQIEKSYGLR